MPYLGKNRYLKKPVRYADESVYKLSQRNVIDREQMLLKRIKKLIYEIKMYFTSNSELDCQSKCVLCCTAAC